MSVQRRRGVGVTIYPSVTTTDARQNTTVRPLGEPIEIKAWVSADRSARAEVPGQQWINVYQLGTASDLAGVDMWSRVQWDGMWWDIVSPPAHHRGTRLTRHWTFIIRQRPDNGGLDG